MFRKEKGCTGRTHLSKCAYSFAIGKALFDSEKSQAEGFMNCLRLWVFFFLYFILFQLAMDHSRLHDLLKPIRCARECHVILGREAAAPSHVIKVYSAGLVGMAPWRRLRSIVR